MIKNCCLLLLLLLPAALSGQTTLKITISGIRSSSGNIRLAFFNSSEGFKNDKPMYYKTVSKSGMSKGKLTVTYTLSPGTYGVALLDDENTNQEMDYGYILPKEGFGFSDYYHTGMSRPVFEDFKFTLKSEAKTVGIKVRYL